MSKTITIYEGEQPITFTASKLITNLSGGGTCSWIPEDEADVSAAILYGTWRAIDYQQTLPAPSVTTGVYCNDSHSVSYFKIAQVGNKRIYCANYHETGSGLNASAYYGLAIYDGDINYTDSSGNKINASMDLQELRMGGITFDENVKQCRCNTSFLDWFSTYFRRDDE